MPNLQVRLKISLLFCFWYLKTLLVGAILKKGVALFLMIND
jgi:hypothetical protein